MDRALASVQERGRPICSASDNALISLFEEIEGTSEQREADVLIFIQSHGVGGYMLEVKGLRLLIKRIRQLCLCLGGRKGRGSAMMDLRS